MSPSKKKVAKPEEVSLEVTPQAVPPKVELPNDENKLFGEDDDQATSCIPDLSMEPEEAKDMLNRTLVHWYCKRQLAVETATSGSEFVTARTTVDQIIDLSLTLIYLGVPINPKSYMFGDNKAVVNNASIPISTLSKRSHLAAYHRV